MNMADGSVSTTEGKRERGAVGVMVVGGGEMVEVGGQAAAVSSRIVSGLTLSLGVDGSVGEAMLA